LKLRRCFCRKEHHGQHEECQLYNIPSLKHYLNLALWNVAPMI
jgi:hypothetical protein